MFFFQLPSLPEFLIGMNDFKMLGLIKVLIIWQSKTLVINFPVKWAFNNNNNNSNSNNNNNNNNNNGNNYSNNRRTN